MYILLTLCSVFISKVPPIPTENPYNNNKTQPRCLGLLDLNVVNVKKKCKMSIN